MREAIVVALRGENDAGRLDDPIQLVLRHCMLPVAMDPRKTSVLLLAVALSCAPKERPLAPRSQTWGELRLLRGTGRVSPPGENERLPYLRERLADGVRIRLDNHALAWCRQDRGATLLVRGPARFVFRPDGLDFDEGRVFIDSPGVDPTSVRTPSGPVRLLGVRASLDVTSTQTVGYVLSGEVDLGSDTHAAPGERFVVAAASVTTSPAVVWEDWTGGLATTTRGPEPPPFGVGTVGARRPGDQGLPRVPLAVQRFDLRVTVEDELATTEVDEVFFNGTSDKVEGIYTFRTPVGASLLRFGVDRGGGIVWGRVKEKKAALAQYTSHVYAGSTEDPALLEWDSPGVYKARLYPVDPGETRRVVVRYTEWLPRSGSRGERRLYVFPMAAEGSDASIPHIEAFGATFDLTRAQAQDVRVGMAGVRQGERIVVRARDLVPRADLALELFDNGVQGVRAYRAPHEVDTEVLAPNDRREAERTAKGESDYLVVPLAESTVSAAEPGIDLALVVDTSA
ncbi:MAG: VIT domain-containing protein, partial [Myxococcales bacterium]